MIRALLGFILALPAPWSPPGRAPETRAEYHRRMAIVATAIGFETRPERIGARRQADLAALVAVTFYHESGFHRDVHDGRRRGGGGRATCLGQIHTGSGIPRDRWLSLTGTSLGATRRCAQATVELLLRQIDRCVRRRGALTRRDAARVLEAYGHGSRCTPGPRSRARSRMWFRLRRALSAAARARHDRGEAPARERARLSSPASSARS